MFEFSVACKYLIPRRRQLSVSIISLISILVIALVVWLIVVFFSVTDGLEKSWVQKLTALTAPVRITPTEAYYNSYYYLVDSISDSSGYSLKTIREKREAPAADPYDPEIDQEIPSFWPSPDTNPDGSLKDPVQLAFGAIEEIRGVPGLQTRDYELSASHIQLSLLRPAALYHAHNIFGGATQSALSYPAFLGNFEGENPSLDKILIPTTTEDLNNFFYLLGTAPISAENESEDSNFTPETLRERLNLFFDYVTIHKLRTRPTGWNIRSLPLPDDAEWTVSIITKDHQPVRVVIPLNVSHNPLLQKDLEDQGLTAVTGKLLIHNNELSLLTTGEKEPRKISRSILMLAGGSSFSAKLEKTSIDHASQAQDLRFQVEIPIQGTVLTTNISPRALEIAEATIQSPSNGKEPPWWLNQASNGSAKQTYLLPSDPQVGEGVILPKSFRDVGVLAGDRGSLSYLSPTPSTLQEQRIPIYVAGFYDPGIIPIGGKFILASQEVTSLIRSSHQQDDQSAITNGINIRFDHFNQAEAVKNQLLQSFKEKGISHYWNIETYREFEFTKEIIRELQSQKNLFMLIAIVIILVACSNIISMLVILVNDKKAEIGILRSMGATSKSIALIFGLSGAIIGVVGSSIGIVAATLTLHNLNALVNLLSILQGHEMFNTHFYGQILPSELSFEALSFVLIATVCMSLLAGVVPAIKASLLRPSQILRSNGG